jgi:hypothetical protein
MHTMTISEVSDRNNAFVQWTTDFSSDTNIVVDTDSRWKKLDGFQDLRAAVAQNQALRGKRVELGQHIPLTEEERKVKEFVKKASEQRMHQVTGMVRTSLK